MPMSDCTNNEMRERLPLLASGRQPSTRDVEAHLEGCDACRTELAFLTSARHALSRAPAVDVARIASAVPAYRAIAVAGDPTMVSLASRRRSAPAWRIAAAALLVLGGGAAVAIYRTDANPPAGAGAAVAVGPAGGTAPDATGGDPVQPTVVATGVDTGVKPSAPQVVTSEGSEMSFGGGLDDLSDEDLVALLAALDEVEGPTSDEPDAVMPIMSLDEEEES